MLQPYQQKYAFTLIELLVVIAIVTLLVSILAPSVQRARTIAKIAKAHVELRNITLAVDMYRQGNKEKIPPTRFSCSTRTAYDLPVELMGYLPGGQKESRDIVDMPDPFNPEQSYRYRAVGTAIMNESTIVPHGATLWIPDGYPGSEANTGQYHSHAKTSPVRYAVWSMGPDATSPKFDIPGRIPIPQKYWLQNAADTGVIVHFEDINRRIHMSP